MKSSIKLITSKEPNNLGYPIYLNLSDGQKRIKRCIGRSDIQFWNENKSEPSKQHPDYFTLYPIILEYKSKIAKINYENYSIEEALNFIFEENKHVDQIGIITFFNTIIDEKKKKKASFKLYETVRDQVSNYIPVADIPINDITYEWLNAFSLYKLSGNCNEAGVKSYLTCIRAVYKEAQRRKSLNVKTDNPFLGLIKSATPKEVPDLKRKDFRKLQKFIPKPSTTKRNAFKMERNIAIWMFQFYIGGHDYIDIALLTWKKINKNRVKFKRYKNRNKKDGGPWVDNGLCPEALDIINKYASKESERVFDFIPNPIKDIDYYAGFRENINRSLSSISGILNLSTTIKTKTPRYAFRSFAGEKLIDTLIVMQLQGHKSNAVTFKYQKKLPYKVLDKQHYKVIDFKPKKKKKKKSKSV